MAWRENNSKSKRSAWKMTDEIVGSISKNTIKKKILDTSSLTKKEVLDEFNELLNNWERNELEIE